ncbi:MAG: phosphate regulatory protein [Pseudomonadota bacterium]|jgi:two-component system, OmpR family, phosphate regulon response regulator PhoB|uniref:Phosphate regulon transcriptional regulatory protein PhoB n=1 Tax=Candidatus Fonsibacter lacus TaxID=2576439 RepID=A0A845S929_9PROT|nr:phosphate regulon transcriptional regulatory protein PhoB [Candidatus Fonsibacter lacus]NBP59613.1 phosphate regulon transcriptional regulatory protein PhoB [Pseudomonadota bacterium]NBP31005.1 phosphate regulon transcriptional regulatory protein PhoB [Candidatus Fonsibacter lacus]NBP99709.1 phosphate regulon transcriptional regulatory protein PhoB [Pseudomonadota bacterium]NBQ46002.1 phosphate regulon transcriptional regulatory protein PhoB [Pseudomonadota bacterium]
MSANIVTVEDEKPLITLLKYNLEKEGYKVKNAETGQEALQLIKNSIPDIVVLDWMLPDFSGIEICKQIKRDKKLKTIPVLMLTAKSEAEDKIIGFESGVDDYLTKPFNNKELILRIKSLLKRSKPSLLEDLAIFKDLKIDRITRKVFRDDKEIKLGPTEYKLLDFLIKSPQRVYSREQLLNNVWGESINVENRTVDVHIRRLRKAINIDKKSDLIRTVRSSGYSLDY